MPFWQVGQLNSWKGTYHVAGQNSDVIEVRRSPTAPSAPTSFTPELFFTSPLPLTLPISHRLPPLLLAAASCLLPPPPPPTGGSLQLAPRATHSPHRPLPPATGADGVRGGGLPLVGRSLALGRRAERLQRW